MTAIPITKPKGGILREPKSDAEAMLPTSLGADAHRIRMTAMASIAASLRFRTRNVESVENRRNSVSTPRYTNNPHQINNIRRMYVPCRSVEARPGVGLIALPIAYRSALYPHLASTFRHDTYIRAKPP